MPPCGATVGVGLAGGSASAAVSVVVRSSSHVDAVARMFALR
jgi:hypothetical protein